MPHRRRFLQTGGRVLAVLGTLPAAELLRTLLPGAGGAASAAAGDPPDGETMAAAAGNPPAELDVIAAVGLGELYGRVVAVGDLLGPGAVVRSNLDALPAERVAERLETGMRTLLGGQAWQRLFGPRDTVAIKINGLAAGHLSPRRELVEAVVAGLRRAGVAPGRIIIWERTTRELQRSGFPRQVADGQVRVYGTDALRGGGYGTTLESYGEVGSMVSEVIGRHATALINIGVLKDHDLAGVSAGLKNLYGVIHNPNRYHDHACDPYVAHVAALPSVRRTLRLTIIDAVVGQAQGGPAFAAQWTWPCDRLLLGVDPVAVDQVASDLLARRRAALDLPTLAETNRAPAWIATAAGIGLGRHRELTVQEV